MKKFLAILLTLAVIASCWLIATADKAEAALYTYYGDNMLFKQADEVVLAGKGTPGAAVTAVLTDSISDTVCDATATIAADGTFSVCFTAPAGGYEEYSIHLSVNGKHFKTLKNVVFGELWLAGGQSNMQMPLSQSETGIEMQKNNECGSDALRFLAVPAMGAYKGDVNNGPALPMEDYETTAVWYKGTDEAVYGMSAVGYFFAEKMIEELDMPVGILNANLGGTSIYTWLSRETVENDPLVLQDCKDNDRYIALKDWKENKVSFGSDMTCNFNNKIAPLKNFRLSGMLWYQGESDLFWEDGQYGRAFDALQRSYTEYFSYKDGLLPIVFTQLAAYSYGDFSALQKKNAEFTVIQQQQPDSRALTSIYDVPLTYLSETHAIHPICKKPVGEKMACAALGLVYDRYDTYTTASVVSVERKNASIYVKLRDVGDGLMLDGDTAYGFAICGLDGIYLPAKAEIVSADTVRIYNENITLPFGATYAYTQYNSHANLYASADGQKMLAVSPFIADTHFNNRTWQNDAWAGCEFDAFWHCHSNEYSGFYSAWNVTNASMQFTADSAYSGNYGILLCADGENGTFSVSPNFTYDENGKSVYFQDIDTDWSSYGTLSFKVRIESEKDVEFSGLQIQANDKVWYTASVADTNSDSVRISADGEWHTVTLDLNRLFPFGNKAAYTYSRNVLGNIRNATFTFTDLDAYGADISIDSFTFTADSEEVKDFDNKLNLDNESDFFTKIKAIFLAIISRILLLFN